jgi:hypothetical protein
MALTHHGRSLTDRILADRLAVEARLGLASAPDTIAASLDRPGAWSAAPSSRVGAIAPIDARIIDMTPPRCAGRSYPTLDPARRVD